MENFANVVADEDHDLDEAAVDGDDDVSDAVVDVEAINEIVNVSVVVNLFGAPYVVVMVYQMLIHAAADDDALVVDVTDYVYPCTYHFFL